MSLLHFSSINNIKTLLQNKKISQCEIISETKKLFSCYDKNLNCALEIFEQPNCHNNENGILYSIPGLIKDVICQKQRSLHCASHILESFVSPYNATVIDKLFLDGALCMGRANCDEFGMGSSNESSYYGPVYNPWNKEYVAGGSSGGSAAAVAAGLVPFSLGAETGGSVRQPASLCGIVGLKPTYGLISRFGLTAYASSLDQIGIFTRNAVDCSTVLQSLAGKDDKDGTSSAFFNNYDYASHVKNFCAKGKKIAVISNALHAKGIDNESIKLFNEALKVMQECGAIIDYITLPTMEYSAALYIVISRAEVASNLARFDGVRYGYRNTESNNLIDMYKMTRRQGFGNNVRRRIMIGNYVLSSGYAHKYYDQARKVQIIMKKEFSDALTKYDFLFSPTSPGPAFKIGEINSNSLAIDLQDYFTSPANLTGLPAVSFPCGFINNMPIGFQLFGNYFKEGDILGMGNIYQQKTEWHLCHPKLV